MTTSKILISASILSADFSHLADQIRILEDSGADWIHIDVMDGHFVPNITMGPFIVDTVRKLTKLPLDVHLMIEEPDNLLSEFAKAGANRLSVHIENTPHINRTLQHIQDLGCHPGIVLNPGTPATAIQEVISQVDLVLVMSVNPGFSGQKFLPLILPKVNQIHLLLQEKNSPAFIEVDGGVTAENLPSLQSSGVKVFVAATSIFKHPGGISAGINALRNAAS